MSDIGRKYFSVGIKHSKSALTTKINDREMFMKGIDYSYCYEQND